MKSNVQNSFIPVPDQLGPEHPMTRIMALISNKWVIDVIYTLSQGTFRYNQLRRILSGISHKMLSQTLDELEDHGLIQRVVYPVIPPKVEYSLTPLGVSLCELLAAFCQWTKEHDKDLP